MSDEFNSDDTGGGSPEQTGPTGADLDRMLAEAADLAAEVSAEVGALAVRADSNHIPIDSLEPDGTDISEKLRELDQMLDRTASEVGAVAPVTNRDAPTPGMTTTLAVPDFMSEFLDAEQAASPPPGTTSAAAPRFRPRRLRRRAASDPNEAESAAASIPEFMSEFTQPDGNNISSVHSDPHALTPPNASRNPPKLGVVGSPVKPFDVNDESKTVGVKTASHKVSPKPPAPAAVPAAPPVVSAGGPAVAIQSVPAAPIQSDVAAIGAEDSGTPGKSGGVALPVATLLVRVMERVDQPFERLGPGPRRLIGVLALLMFGASIVVFAASLL